MMSHSNENLESVEKAFKDWRENRKSSRERIPVSLLERVKNIYHHYSKKDIQTCLNLSGTQLARCRDLDINSNEAIYDDEKTRVKQSDQNTQANQPSAPKTSKPKQSAIPPLLPDKPSLASIIEVVKTDGTIIRFQNVSEIYFLNCYQQLFGA